MLTFSIDNPTFPASYFKKIVVPLSRHTISAAAKDAFAAAKDEGI